MNFFIEKISGIESLIISDISVSKIQLLACYVVFIALILILKKMNFKTVQYLLISLLLLQVSTIYAKASIPAKEALIFNFSKKTIIAEKDDHKLTVYTQTDSIVNLKDYNRERRITKMEMRPLPKYFQMDDKIFMLLDTAEVFPKLKIRPDLVLLRNSPKINFERFLDSVQPKAVVADGSNFTSFAKKWKETGAQKKIPFHYTSEKGSFTIFQKN